MHDIYMTITTHSHSKILELPKHEQALALYLFYYRHAKIQKTNQPWATIPFCMKGLGWGRDKVISARNSLKSIGLIQDIRPGVGEKTYTKLNFITSERTTNSIFDDMDNDTTENTHSRRNGDSENDNVTNSDTTENTTLLKTEHKCLKNKKNKCLKNKKKKDKSFSDDSDESLEKGLKPVNKKLPKIIKSNSCSSSSKIAPQSSNNNSCSSKKSLSPKDRKANIAKQKKPKKPGKSKKKFTYTPTDFRNYNMLIKAGATDHKETDQTYYDTMDKIHMLFSDKYDSPLIGASNLTEELYDYTWNIDEVVEIFDHYMKHAIKKNKNVGKFIITEKNKNNPNSYSPLINWAERLINGDDILSDKAKKLYKSLKKRIEKSNSKRNIDSFHKIPAYKLNAAATFLDEVEQKYELLSPPISVQPGYEMIVVFSDYIMNEKLLKKGDDWKLVEYISTQITQDDFIHDMLKRNAIRKKKKNGIDFNARVS